MENVSKREGRTVLFVSHNMDAVQELCARVILFHAGQIQNEGSAAKVIQEYLTEKYSSIDQRYEFSAIQADHNCNKAILRSAELLNSKGRSCSAILFGEPFAFRMHWERRQHNSSE